MLLASKPKGETELHTCDNHDKSEEETDGEESGEEAGEQPRGDEGVIRRGPISLLLLCKA